MQSGSGKNGQFFQSDFANNVGGTNLVDSVFKISDTQAAGGFNFDYILTGGIRKRLGPVLINAVADAQLNTLGFGLYATASGGTKQVMRAAGTKLQLFDTSDAVFTNLTEDNAAVSSNPFNSSSTETVNFVQFNNGNSNILWGAGGGAGVPVGAYSTTKYTENGVAAPTGSLAAVVNAHGGGDWTAAGDYYYSIVYHKASTGVLSNAALDLPFTIVNTDDSVTLDLSMLTGLDQTLVNQFYIFRSARSGVVDFTTGNLIAQIPSSSTSFTDLGDLGNPDILLNQNVPRAGNIILDNSNLPAGTYTSLTIFKQRLITSQNSTVYISDVNKSESWPTTNIITIPSAGPITAMAVVSFTSPQAQSLDELLVIFKEREMWVINGSDYTNFALLSIDNSTGCPQQSLIVNAQGFLSWIDFRGIHLWDGTGKPYYASRLLEPLFGLNGDLDKTKLGIGVGEFFRRENQIVWYLSSKTYGEQKFSIKLDVRLTLLQIEQQLTGRNIDAVLIQDTYPMPIYAAMSYIPLDGNQEQMVLGDNAGFCYFAANGYSNAGDGIDWTYLSPALSMGDPNTQKQFHKVIVWVQDLGNWNLELDYWTDYRVAAEFETSQTLQISTENQSSALWDIATWDLSYWDDYAPNIVPMIFNLLAGNSNTAQGSAIQLQFKNSNADEPVTIHGFSVLWSPLGGVTA